MKRLLFVSVFVLVAGFFAVFVSAADTFDLTIPLPLTGKQAKFGEIMKRSYEMAAEEINAKGGIKGKRLVLSFEDSSGKPETARAIVEKLIDVKETAAHRRRIYVRPVQRLLRPLPRSVKPPTSWSPARMTTSPSRTTSMCSARTR